MRRGVLKAAVVCVVLGWLPYLALRGYWAIITTANPRAAHGEASGPILYFLPRLLWVGMVVTLLAIAGVVGARVVSAWEARREPRPPGD